MRDPKSPLVSVLKWKNGVSPRLAKPSYVPTPAIGSHPLAFTEECRRCAGHLRCFCGDFGRWTTGDLGPYGQGRWQRLNLNHGYHGSIENSCEVVGCFIFSIRDDGSNLSKFLDRLKHQSGSCVRDQLVAWGDPSAGGDCTWTATFEQWWNRQWNLARVMIFQAQRSFSGSHYQLDGKGIFLHFTRLKRLKTCLHPPRW